MVSTKRLQVTMKATAEIEEIWILDVPGNWDGDPGELLDFPFTHFVSDRVVGEERDREVTDVEVIAVVDEQ